MVVGFLGVDKEGRRWNVTIGYMRPKTNGDTDGSARDTE